MVKNYLVTAWRNLFKNKLSTVINIMGLAVGMTIAMLIGLWIWDELSFNKYHRSYDRLVQVMDNEFIEGQASTSEAIAIPVADELRTSYSRNIKRIALVYPNFGWHLAEGRDFSRNFPADTGSLIINQAAAKLIRFKHPVGEVIHFDGRDRKITGVVDNMIMESPYMSPRPMIFQLDYGFMINLAIRLKPGIPVVDAVKKIESVFSKDYPAGIFDYRFTDEEYAKKFSDQRVISHLSMIFTVLAIFISCLGLTGLSSFMAEQRRKEIGIRRVLGASVLQLWLLLVSGFVQLILLSILVASPLIWYFMERWLQQFSYRTNISWWIYALAGLGVIGLAVLTVSFQSFKAARMNPSKSLKSN